MDKKTLEEIAAENKVATITVEIGEALKRLMDNPDYKKVITEGYLANYPKELGIAIAKNTGGYNTDILVENLKGINTFVGYTFQVAANHTAAEKTLIDNAKFMDQDGESDE